MMILNLLGLQVTLLSPLLCSLDMFSFWPLSYLLSPKKLIFAAMESYRCITGVSVVHLSQR